MNRLDKILSHVNPSTFEQKGRARFSPNSVSGSEDDIVVVSALRTAIGKAKKGSFKQTSPIDLMAAVLKETMERTKVDPKLVGDLVVGNVLPPGGGALSARQAMFVAGLPEEIPVTTVNRQCSSGLQAFANVASSIKAGYYDVGIAAGVESMSSHDMMSSAAEYNVGDTVTSNKKASDCLIPMGMTSENVAEKYGQTRHELDSFAAKSHEKAAFAQKNGWFKAEIVPVTVEVDGEKKVVTEDEGIRAGTTAEKLGKLRAAFKDDGVTTAGNSSQVSDGAAAVLVTKRSVAEKHGWKILGALKGFSVNGVPPEVMGIGPAYAIPEALKMANMTVDDIDIFEINEAFATQAKWCAEKLSIPMEKLNPKGGAIAFGHPLGMTGARQIATLLHELERTNKKRGVVSMCIGTGMGAAAVFERS